MLTHCFASRQPFPKIFGKAILKKESVFRLPTQNPVVRTFFSFPDEWEKHEGTILIFPAKHSYGIQSTALQNEFSHLANEIQKNEQVYVFVHPNDIKQAKSLLNPKIKIHSSEKYSIDWARDNAPLIIKDKNGNRKAVCFKFNGWGKKYNGWEKDVGVNLAIAKHLKLPIVESQLVLEGGAVEIGSTDTGQIGIATEQCVLNPNRTNWTKKEVEDELKEKIGLEKIIWIPKGLSPDPVTDGHIDGLLKFIDTNTVLLHTTEDKDDENYKICQDAKKILKSNGLKVIELPLMDDIVHMNFYIGSGGDVIYLPICGDKRQDDPIIKILKKYFKKIIPVKAVAIGKAGGGIHCYTQQIPK